MPTVVAHDTGLVLMRADKDGVTVHSLMQAANGLVGKGPTKFQDSKPGVVQAVFVVLGHSGDVIGDGDQSQADETPNDQTQTHAGIALIIESDLLAAANASGK
ncbi:hypothetical protein ASD54_07920 [Rhizobium sp. Root149]|nr:hypothetical protein ASD54_07920 [Rhizobium sp. Root149]